MPEAELELSNNIENIWESLFMKGKEVDFSLVSVKAKFTEVCIMLKALRSMSKIDTKFLSETHLYPLQNLFQIPCVLLPLLSSFVQLDEKHEPEIDQHQYKE